MRYATLVVVLLLAALVVLPTPDCGGPAATGERIRLATTTSTANSGLLEWLLPPFEAREGIRVDVVPVGTGQALEIGRRGDADLVLVHARALEDAFVAEGAGVDRRDVMWNDFVVLGPPDDPAAIRGGRDGAAALERVARAGLPFVSRGDRSGTHVREEELWRTGGGRPSWEDYLDAGQGMGACLTIADEKRAYVLADRGTYLAFRGRIDLDVLVEGDPSLHNPYGAILVNPARHPAVHAAAARKLLDYLTSPEGQTRIAAFRVGGEVLFHPVAAD